MPDDDRMPRSLSGGWRRVLKAIQAKEPQEDIVYHVARATAETLRRAHGIPDLPALSVRLHQATIGSSSRLGDDDDGYRALPGHIPARRLLAHPDATGLRAPAQRRLKLAMADLMDIDIEAM